MFRYRARIVVLSLGVLFGYAAAYRHLTHGHGHGHGHPPWRDGNHECWHWPGEGHSDKPGRGPGPHSAPNAPTPGAGAAEQVH